MVHALYGDVTAKCPACMREPALREAWGCDAPASERVLEITCSVCNGADAQCVACGGGGVEPLFRCPQSACTPELVEAFGAYAVFTEHGVMPARGAWLDQTRDFHDFVRIVNAERAEIDKGRAMERSNGR